MSNSRFAKHAITANCQFQWNFHSKAHKKLSEITHRVKYISILNCELQMYYRRITTKSTPEIQITSDGSFCVRSFLSFHLFGAFFFPLSATLHSFNVFGTRGIFNNSVAFRFHHSIRKIVCPCLFGETGLKFFQDPSLGRNRKKRRKKSFLIHWADGYLWKSCKCVCVC